MSMTFDLLKQRSLERQNKNKYNSKKVESEICIELKEMLDEYLLENDKIMIEVKPMFESEFINALNNSGISAYEYTQLDTNKYIFSNKELKFF